MNELEIKNAAGIRFLIEGASDRMSDDRSEIGTGYFASPIKGNDILSGIWFETKDQAIAACHAYRGPI